MQCETAKLQRTRLSLSSGVLRGVEVFNAVLYMRQDEGTYKTLV